MGAADVLYICLCIVRPHQVQPLLLESCLHDSAENITVQPSFDMLSHASQLLPSASHGNSECTAAEGVKDAEKSVRRQSRPREGCDATSRQVQLADSAHSHRCAHLHASIRAHMHAMT